MTGEGFDAGFTGGTGGAELVAVRAGCCCTMVGPWTPNATVHEGASAGTAAAEAVNGVYG